MRVELLYFDECPNYKSLLPRLREIAAETGIAAQVDLRRITDDDAARRARFLGSPTVRVEGHDVEPDAEQRTDYGIKCRLYRTTTGLSGQPSEQSLREALRRAAEAR